MTAQRILACDDEAHITRTISMKLTKAGFVVETTNNGLDGWEAIQRELPALLITDLQMPGLDGLELCRRLRSEPSTQNLPVILLTAKGFELDSDNLISELQLTDVMVKPFSPRELLKRVQSTLGLSTVSL